MSDMSTNLKKVGPHFLQAGTGLLQVWGGLYMS